MNGRIRFWDGARAYGFIRSDDSAADVFFHLSGVLAGGAAPEKERDARLRWFTTRGLASRRRSGSLLAANSAET